MIYGIIGFLPLASQGAWCSFPLGKNELIPTFLMGKLVVFVTKGNCAKKGLGRHCSMLFTSAHAAMSP